MRTIKEIVFSNDFFKNSLILISGTTIAQLIPVAISPVISRLFNSNDFAVLGIYISLVAIISGIAAATYEFAIVLPKKDEDARDLLYLSVIISVLTFVLSLFFVTFFKRPISLLLNNPDISHWLFMVPFSVLFLTINSILLFWFNRKKEYIFISLNKIIRTTSISISNLILGFIKIFNGGLILSQVFGDCAATFVLTKKYLKTEGSIKIKRENLTRVAKDYRKFPMFNFPNTLLNTLSFQLPVILISVWFNPTMTGGYFFSTRILAVPIALIGASVAQVFYQRFNELIHENKHYAKRFLYKVWLILFVIGIIPFGLLFFFGTELFRFIFGPEWETAGTISAMLAPMILFMFVSSPTSSTYLVLGKQNINIFFGLAMIVYRPLAIFVGYHCNDLFLGLKLLVVFEIVEVIIYNSIVLKYLKG